MNLYLMWNPNTTGCKFCYAEIMPRRLQAMGIEKYKDGFAVELHHPDALRIPYTWKTSKIVFVNLMSDLFHENFHIEFIQRVFDVMNDNPAACFSDTMKRAERLLKLHSELKWTHNISVENDKVKHRIDLLRKTKAKVKFLSCEPLIVMLCNMNLKKIDWVIVGEKSRSSTTANGRWIGFWIFKGNVKKADVAFFFKQWGGRNKKKNGRLLNGKTYDQMPEMVELERE